MHSGLNILYLTLFKIQIKPHPSKTPLFSYSHTSPNHGWDTKMVNGGDRVGALDGQAGNDR